MTIIIIIMKKTLIKGITFSLVVLLAACSNDKHAGDSHDGHAPVPTVAKVQSAAVKLKDGDLNAIYQHYQHLTTVLTEGDVAAAKVASIAIEAGAKEIEGGTKLRTTAVKISRATKLETQRIIFASLSDEFIALVKRSGLESGELHIAHCPMALNDKGADWVSNSKDISNPYYGQSMLTCGTIKETIKL